jgi:hypothetical protein
MVAVKDEAIGSDQDRKRLSVVAAGRLSIGFATIWIMVGLLVTQAAYGPFIFSHRTLSSIPSRNALRLRRRPAIPSRVICHFTEGSKERRPNRRLSDNVSQNILILQTC